MDREREARELEEDDDDEQEEAELDLEEMRFYGGAGEPETPARVPTLVPMEQGFEARAIDGSIGNGAGRDRSIF